ncbi:predicted protein [Histoplasma mississippiense (nom. inval.)]|uniref:predicted protein n=1 Tax=Ajellomyces capsulatus (strain NAm1 / WU24) TaxID=2059318 RepID=UPI000157BC54|nr:predicted protein [Histoplasma mississippiense (nom. inval.)]EDN05545.1 predicted protein [Histoplasma mississippiense (nom. inval.)]
MDVLSMTVIWKVRGYNEVWLYISYEDTVRGQESNGSYVKPQQRAALRGCSQELLRWEQRKKHK